MKRRARAYRAQALLDAVKAPVFVLQEGHIQAANRAAIQLSGCSSEDLRGLNPTELFLPADPADAEQLALALAGSLVELTKTPAFLDSCGQRALVWLSASLLEDASPQQKTNSPQVVVSLTERFETTGTGEWNDHDQAVSDLLAALESERAQSQHRTGELREVINALPDAVIIYDERGRARQANPAARELFGFDPANLERERIIDRLSARKVDGRELTVADMPSSQALLGRRVRGIRLTMTGPMGSDVQVLASASPLYSEGRLSGAVSIWSDVSEIAQRRRELDALAQVASALRLAIVPEEMFPIALNQVMDLLNVEGASLLLPDEGSGDLTVAAGAGAWSTTVGQRVPKDTGISSQVMADGQPFFSNDIQTDPRLVRSVFIGSLPCGACVPLSVQGKNIGVLWVGRTLKLGESDVRLLGAVADITASHIFRASLFEQTQLRFQRLSALHSIDMAITSSLDLQLTLSVLLDQVVSQMRVDAADILLFDPALHWLEYASGRGFLIPSVRMDPQRLADTPAGQVALERRILAIPDLLQREDPTDRWLSPQEGFRSYFAAPLIAKGQVKGVLELFNREVCHPDDEWMGFLETLATQAAIAIDSAELFQRLQRTNEDLSQAYDATIEGWSRALELRDQETHGHAQRVSELTLRLARRMSVNDEQIAHYRRGVLLHDIGKMAIPDSILLKEGPLTADEQELMHMHPIYAYELLRPITYLRPALDIPYCHHEWWNGRGYPRGLKGEEIPLPARIFAVVDVWDALRSDRSYRPRWPVQKVLDHIRAHSGTQFDPQVVEVFIKMMQSYESGDRYFPSY